MPQAGGSFLPGETADVRGWSVADRFIELSVNGPVPILSGTYFITKTGALLAATLRAPTLAENGTVMRFVSGTAFAHTVTATALIQNGVVGGAKSAWTAAAFPGSSITLVAGGGFWNEVARTLGAVA
jgi:hypothetical protein